MSVRFTIYLPSVSPCHFLFIFRGSVALGAARPLDETQGYLFYKRRLNTRNTRTLRSDPFATDAKNTLVVSFFVSPPLSRLFSTVSRFFPPPAPSGSAHTFPQRRSSKGWRTRVVNQSIVRLLFRYISRTCYLFVRSYGGLKGDSRREWRICCYVGAPSGHQQFHTAWRFRFDPCKILWRMRMSQVQKQDTWSHCSFQKKKRNIYADASASLVFLLRWPIDDEMHVAVFVCALWVL